MMLGASQVWVYGAKIPCCSADETTSAYDSYISEDV